MYCLVRYVEDNIMHIVPTKSLSEIEEKKLYWAPYKRMGYYEAVPLAFHNDRCTLQKKQNKLLEICEGVQKDEKISTRAKSIDEKNQTSTILQQNLSKVSEVRNFMKPVKIVEAKSSKGSKSIGGKSQKTNNHNVILAEENVLTDWRTKTNINEYITPSTSHQKDDSKVCNTLKRVKIGQKKTYKDSTNFGNREINPNRTQNSCAIYENQNYCKNSKLPIAHETISAEQNIFGDLRMGENAPGVVEPSTNQKNISELGNQKKKLDRKSSHKRHCCLFCKKHLYQIVRHWSTSHKTESEVIEIINLHPSSLLRKQKIERLRKKGDYEFNNTSSSGKKIVSRISKNDTDFVPCPSCLGYFSATNLRHHKQKCSPNNGSRSLQGNSRKLTTHIHIKASNTLKNVITPDMHHDEISNQIFFDEILVIYGNFLCIKYTEDHLKNHIRAQLRLLGRFMLRVKFYDPSIKDCAELIHPRNIDIIRQSIDDIAELDSSTNIYKHPTNARTLVTELKKIILVVKSESDKKEDDLSMKRAKALSRRIKQEVKPYVNRLCKNSENRIKRLKQNNNSLLPENAEIGIYLQRLYKNILYYQNLLKRKFSLVVWTQLTQTLMVYLAVFNRKRPGETQRIEVSDFMNREGVSERDLSVLDESERILAGKYERIGFKGKLGNSTALLIDKTKVLPALQLIIAYRKKAGIHSANRFLFAKPSQTEKNATFDAFRCHKLFCQEMKIDNKNLGFTKLRKHFATEVAKKGTTEEEEKRVSDYMSHNYTIHRKIYDQSSTLIDITRVSKHLEGSALYETNSISKEEYHSARSLKRKIYSDENYSPGQSSYSDNEPSLEEVEEFLGKFKKRRTWSSEEKKVARLFFEDEILFNRPLTNQKVKELKEIHRELFKGRSRPMIIQWVKGEVLKIDEYDHELRDKRPRYSTPEKEILKETLERHSLDKSEPSVEEFEDLILKHDCLRKRSADSLERKYRRMALDC